MQWAASQRARGGCRWSVERAERSDSLRIDRPGRFSRDLRTVLYGPYPQIWADVFRRFCRVNSGVCVWFCGRWRLKTPNTRPRLTRPPHDSRVTLGLPKFINCLGVVSPLRIGRGRVASAVVLEPWSASPKERESRSCGTSELMRHWALCYGKGSEVCS